MNPKITKNEVKQMTVKEKVAMGKDIEHAMAIEKEKLSHESQVLKDRMEIQEQVDATKGYNKKMIVLKQLLRSCQTTKHYEKMRRINKAEQQRFVRKQEEERLKIL